VVLRSTLFDSAPRLVLRPTAPSSCSDVVQATFSIAVVSIGPSAWLRPVGFCSMVPPLEFTATPQARPASFPPFSHAIRRAGSNQVPWETTIKASFLSDRILFNDAPLVFLPCPLPAAAAAAASPAASLSRVQTLHHQPDAHTAAGVFIFLRDCQFHWDFHLPNT
jgi:hypothetical protein